MEKTNYEECEIEVITFEGSDVIVTSPTNDFDGEWG